MAEKENLIRDINLACDTPRVVLGDLFCIGEDVAGNMNLILRILDSGDDKSFKGMYVFPLEEVIHEGFSHKT